MHSTPGTSVGIELELAGILLERGLLPDRRASGSAGHSREPLSAVSPENSATSCVGPRTDEWRLALAPGWPAPTHRVRSRTVHPN